MLGLYKVICFLDRALYGDDFFFLQRVVKDLWHQYLGGTEEDCYEFLSFLLIKLHDDLKVNHI